ncbi:MAG: succinylglutamate desuccinylase, partial [Pyrinomonadaceae bacterium]|nr:succinylglutamate desuccinylase [Pyrinomonadaceae bacterium]
HADVVIDLHAGAGERFNYPQIRYDLFHEENIRLARAFDAPFTLLQNKAPKGSIRRVLNDAGTPTIIFEGGKSKTIDDQVVETGVQGVRNVLNYLGIRKNSDDNIPQKTKFLHRNRWIRARHSGMFQPLVDNGSFVEKRQVLANINGPYAQFQKKIRSPMDGWIFCVSQAAVVNLGDAVFHIGEEQPK